MKALVLDANILIRAVLGTKVNSLITTYAKQAQFYTPQECFEDARRYLPDILSSKGIPTDAAIAALDALAQLVGSVEPEWYGAYEGGKGQNKKG